MMQRTGASPLARQVLVVAGGPSEATSAAARSVRALVTELRARNIDVLEAVSYEDGLATVVSDAGIHCILVDWTQSRDDSAAREQATELLRAVRARNAKVPIFLMASRKIAGSVSVETATLADEYIWILADTAPFIAGRVQASIERYL
jgi:arginine decarboxylase